MTKKVEEIKEEKVSNYLDYMTVVQRTLTYGERLILKEAFTKGFEAAQELTKDKNN